MNFITVHELISNTPRIISVSLIGEVTLDRDNHTIILYRNASVEGLRIRESVDEIGLLLCSEASK